MAFACICHATIRDTLDLSNRCIPHMQCRHILSALEKSFCIILSLSQFVCLRVGLVVTLHDKSSFFTRSKSKNLCTCLSFSGYTFNSSTSSSEGLEFSAVIGVIVMVIVSAIVFTIIVVWCCCIRSRRSSGTVLRQNYQAAPVASSNSTNTTQTWGPQTQGIQPSG